MKKKLLIIALCIVIAAAIYPFESMVVPRWKVKVVDVNGKVCDNMPVTEMWGHYSLFLDGRHQSADLNSNRDGFVEFPERRVRAIGIRRLIMPVVTQILTIAHGSTGADGAVATSGLIDVAWLSYKEDLPLPDIARVKKCITKADLRSNETQ
ncbi:MAG: hypothetical protein KDB79_16950 [Acidobacteria bacterium]|nr:hypothetical protein [Acidobacteriota bacterium]